MRTSSVSKDKILRQTSNFTKDLNRLSRIPKIMSIDTRGELLNEFEKFRYREVVPNNQANKTNLTNQKSISQKNFFANSKTPRQTTKSLGSNITNTVGRKHPLLDIKLGREFEKLGPFKIHLEGDFGSIEFSESMTVQLQKIVLPRVETLTVTASVYTIEPLQEPVDSRQPCLDHLFGLKHFELPFSKEPTQLKIVCGPQMNQTLGLTLRLYS